MGEAVGWTGIVLAVAAMIRGEFAAYTARQLAKEKAEADRLAAHDKMEFDLKAKELELNAAAQRRELQDVRAALAECREQHLTSEQDRRRLWDELDAIKKGKS